MSAREDLLEMVATLRREVSVRRSSYARAWKSFPEIVAPAPFVPTPSVPAVEAIPTVAPVLKESPAQEYGKPLRAVPPADKAEQLRVLLEAEIGDCHRCPLGDTRIKLAFGVGNPDARVMFIGEGPGYMEDRAGEPFVGPAGQLLDKILIATGLSRQKTEPASKWVYIANMVKCHPMVEPSEPEKRGNDRPPTPEEMAVCSPFLMKQIGIVRPDFIVALGATASKALLKTSRGITSFRGQWFDYVPDGIDDLSIRLLPTYHPAALLRSPDLKRDVWEDMKKLRSALEASRS